MKRIVGFVLIILSVLALSACAQRRDQAPVISGAEDITIDIGQAFNPMTGVTASDREDGNLTSSITFEGWEEGDQNFPGDSEITYTVIDSKGNSTSVTRKVTVIGDVSIPVISGHKANVTYYTNTATYNPLAGVVALDPLFGDITEDIIILGNYNLNVPGTYAIRLRVENEAGGRTTVNITLTVVDAGIPLAIPTNTPITITMWHSNGSDITALYNKYARSFEAKMASEYNAQVTVNIAASYGTYTALRQSMIQAITAGTYPNIVQGYPDHVAEYRNGRVVVNLDPYIQHNTWGLHGADALDDILEPYRLENSQYNTEGNFFSLPLNKSTEVMIYNKTVLTELGLSVPQTWQDIIAMGPALRAHAQAKGTQNFMPAAYDSDGNAFITFTRQFGGSYTAFNYETGRGQFLFHTNQNTFSAMQFLKDNRNTITLPGHWNSDYATNAFLAQQVYITVGSTAGVWRNVPGGYTTNGLGTTFEIGVAPVPYNADRPQDRAVIQQGTNLSVLNKGTSIEQLVSFLFLKHMISTENTVDFAINTGYLPVRYSGQFDPTYVEFLGRDKDAKALAAKAAFEQSAYFFYDPAFVGSSLSRLQVGLALDRIMRGDGNIQEALNDAFSNANIGG